MNKYIILITSIIVSITNCNQSTSNKNNSSIVEKENRIASLSNNESPIEKSDIEILLDSAVKVKNGTLFFSYKVINTSSINLFLYHIQKINILSELAARFESDTINYPLCNILIIDSNNKLPQSIRVEMRDYFIADSNNVMTTKDLHKKTYPEDMEYSYTLLPAKKYKTLHGKIHIGNCNLTGENFKLKLKYSSRYNKHFINKFKKMQTRNPKLKEYERFEGVIESNKVSFTLQ